jgi:hypothetical protein
MKWFVKSKTIWGVVVMALPALLPAVGVNLTGDDTTLITSTGDSLLQTVGGALAIWGRFSAGGLSIKPE